ncbi:MAG: hypothetical protein DRP85_02785 [Candidatus Makaraimicrobium thalassicum]|nr:MAG: hypothetical protein DRP85_02785 [Candidatus Omnitrophota bacterium]
MFALLIAAGVLTAGCASSAIKGVDVYTFEKDRVDQKIGGNQGYLTGRAPAAPAKTRETKRTLIGVDIEVPAFFAGKGGEGDTEAQPQKTSGSSVKKKVRQKETAVRVEKKTVAVDAAEKSGAGDEWIK